MWKTLTGLKCSEHLPDQLEIWLQDMLDWSLIDTIVSEWEQIPSSMFQHSLEDFPGVEAVIPSQCGLGFEIKRVNKYSQSCPHTMLIHCQVYFGRFRHFSRIVSVDLWLYSRKPSRQDCGTPRLLSCREEKVFFTFTICWRGIILPLRPPLSLNPHF